MDSSSTGGYSDRPSDTSRGVALPEELDQLRQPLASPRPEHDAARPAVPS